MSTETKDRITCHVLDTTLGQPARGLRVKLELLSTTSTTTSSSANIHTATHANFPPPPPTNPTIFESQTDDDGRVRAWLPYSSATSSGEVPVYTLEDVLGGIAAAAGGGGGAAGAENGVDGGSADGAGGAGGGASSGGDGEVGSVGVGAGAARGGGRGGGESRWTLRFDTAGYFGGADKTFYPEVVVTFTVREGERYHVPLLLAPYGYSTYRGS